MTANCRDAALAWSAFYIGALGSRRTHAKRCEALSRRGHGEADIARIKAPIGLFDRARDAGSLALSVVAEVAQMRLRGGEESPPCNADRCVRPCGYELIFQLDGFSSRP